MRTILLLATIAGVYGGSLLASTVIDKIVSGATFGVATFVFAICLANPKERPMALRVLLLWIVGFAACTALALGIVYLMRSLGIRD